MRREEKERDLEKKKERQIERERETNKQQSTRSTKVQNLHDCIRNTLMYIKLLQYGIEVRDMEPNIS